MFNKKQLRNIGYRWYIVHLQKFCPKIYELKEKKIGLVLHLALVSKGRLKIVQTLFLQNISVKLRIEYLKANINYNCFWTITVCEIIKKYAA